MGAFEVEISGSIAETISVEYFEVYPVDGTNSPDFDGGSRVEVTRMFKPGETNRVDLGVIVIAE